MMTERIVVFDRDQRSVRRDWNRIFECTSVTCVQSIDAVRDLDCDVVVAHALKHDLQPLAAIAQSRQIPIIVISGSEKNDSGEYIDARVYQRKASVSTGMDAEFGRCVERFLAFLRATDQDNWELLEPAPWPQALIVLCVIFTAYSHAEADELELLNREWGEFELRTGRSVWNCARTQTEVFDEANLERWKAAGLSHEHRAACPTPDESRRILRVFAELLPSPMEIPLAEDFRAPFSHTWIKNRLLAQLRTESDAWILQFDEQECPSVISGIATRLDDLDNFITNAEWQYSASHLVNQAPLLNLSEPARKIISRVCHDVFLRETQWKDKQTVVNRAADSLRDCAEQFVATWESGSSDHKILRGILGAVETAAITLKSSLESLPNGVVLHDERRCTI